MKEIYSSQKTLFVIIPFFILKFQLWQRLALIIRFILPIRNYRRFVEVLRRWKLLETPWMRNRLATVPRALPIGTQFYILQWPKEAFFATFKCQKLEIGAMSQTENQKYLLPSWRALMPLEVEDVFENSYTKLWCERHYFLKMWKL